MKFQDDISNMNTYVRTYIHTYGQAETNMPPPPLFQSWGHKNKKGSYGQNFIQLYISMDKACLFDGTNWNC